MEKSGGRRKKGLIGILWGLIGKKKMEDPVEEDHRNGSPEIREGPKVCSSKLGSPEIRKGPWVCSSKLVSRSIILELCHQKQKEPVCFYISICSHLHHK